MKGMIDVTGIDFVKFAKKVYELSSPQGLGILNSDNKLLTENEAKAIIKNWKGDYLYVVSMDYIKGRSCKMDVIKKEGKMYMPESWYDHSGEDLKELLKSVGI